MRTLKLIAALTLLVGCHRQVKAADGMTVTAEEFKTFHWISGQWIGTGPDGVPFAEGYAVIDDSTIRSYSWADTTFQQVSDSSLLSLRQGAVTSGSGTSYYVLTRWKGTEMHFEPRGQASNAFTWRYLNANRWRATLTWTDAKGVPQQRVYQMVRRLL